MNRLIDVFIRIVTQIKNNSLKLGRIIKKTGRACFLSFYHVFHDFIVLSMILSIMIGMLLVINFIFLRH